MPLGALLAAENWILEDGELRVRSGHTAFANDINQRPTAYIQYEHNDGNNRVVMATTVGWHKLSASSWVSITDIANPLTGGPTDLNVFRVFQKNSATHLLGTNGANTMKKWDGNAATYSAVGGNPPRCKTMMVLFDRIIVGHLLSGGTISGLAIDTSALQDFDSGWGSILVAIVGAETPGAIVAMQENGSLVGSIFKEDAIVLAIAQAGASSPFRFETKVTNVPGPASARAVCAPSDGLNLVLANNGAIMRWDTVSYVSLGSKFQAHIQKVANMANLGRAFAHYDSTKNHAWFFYPERGSNDPMVGIVVNLNNLSMWPFRLPWAVSAASAANTDTGLTIGQLTSPIGSITQTLGELGSQNSIPRTLLGETGGQAYEQRGESDGGTAIPFYFQTGRNALSNGARYKTVQSAEHRFKRTTLPQNVSVQVGISDAGEDEALSTPKTLDLAAPPYITGHRKTGKFLSIRMSGSASQPITYRGSYVHVAPRGLR